MGTRNFAEYNPGAAELGRKNQPGGYVGYGGGLYPFSASSLTIAPGTSVIPANNGEITLDLPNKSRLRFSAKGDDGQIRWFLPAQYNHATNSLSIGDIGDIYKNGLQGNAAWNTTVIGQLAAAGIAPLPTDIITDTVVIGTYAGNKFYKGNGNAICGNRSMQDIEISNHNTAYGDSAWRFLTSGSDGTAVGYVVGQEVLSLDGDVYIGSYCGAYVTATSKSVLIGYYAGARDPGQKRPLGNNVIGIGDQALRYADGANIIGLGQDAFRNTIGANNVGIGARTGDGITTGSNNTFLGTYAGYSSGGIQKPDAIGSIGIGYNVRTTKSYQAMLGSSAITETILRGKVQWNPPASAVPDDNGQITFEFTDNSTIKLKAKGSDGVVRVAELMLVEPDPYGPELLENTALTGYVTGSPGTVPTSWGNLQSTGSLQDPALTFDGVATRRAIFQTESVTPGTYKLETTVTVNSGTAVFQDLIFYSAPVGSSVTYLIDDVAATNTSAVTGTKKLTIMVVAINSGTMEFRIGAGVLGDRTQNVTHANPTMKKQN